MCARNTRQIQGACPGDSGGPMTTEINGFYFQIGLIQGGLSACSNKSPGVFVRIDNPKILKYINDEVGQFLPKRTVPAGKFNNM